jgi:hypothetical protein
MENDYVEMWKHFNTAKDTAGHKVFPQLGSLCSHFIVADYAYTDVLPIPSPQDMGTDSEEQSTLGP